MPAMHQSCTRSPAAARPVDRAGDTTDHIAFGLANHDAMCRKLERLGMAHSPIALPKLCEGRLFIHTHSGIVIELVSGKGSERSSLLS